MKHNLIGVLFACLCVSFAHAALTVHIQSPWRNDASYSNYVLYLFGGATDYGANAKTVTVAEGDGWFSYTWDQDVSNFSWQDFTVHGCPSTDGCNGAISWSISASEVKFQVSTLFASEDELWIYTTADSYTVSLTPPGSKIVWFKSPWGIKALPQMIFGQDTILMRVEYGDSSKCGWFKAPISPSSYKSNAIRSVYFQRYMAGYLSYPADGTIELLNILDTYDTIYIDGTVPSADVALKIGDAGACFDSSRTMHVYSPWRTNTSIRDSALYLDAGNIGQAIQMDSVGEYKYWWKHSFSAADVSGQQWSSAKLNIKSNQNGSKLFWPNTEGWHESPNKPMLSSFFPKGIYEVWVYTKGNEKYEMLFAPLEEKVIRLLSPWSNMAPLMFVDGDTIKMGPISKDTCGWYQGISYKHVTSWEVYFRQAFGFEYFSASGVGDAPGDPIMLDTAMAISDIVWVQAIPLKQTLTYPSRLGDCPTMKISALVVDWAGEGVRPDGEPSYSQNWDKAQDVDFGGIYDGNEYTVVMHPDSTGTLTEYKSCQGLVTGMVVDTLVNGLPARVDSLKYPWSKCSAAREIEKWFVPVEVAKDAAGNSYTNGVCRDIDLTLDDEGFWLADISESHEDGGFFPIDDLEYLDSAKTVKNPKFDWSDQLTAGGKKHNYSFSMKISAQFQYVKGQYFEFRGDDDVWVYINNRLVVDIGGCHGPIEGFVDLDTIGQGDPTLKLVEGQEYPFHIFFSERNATGSNFKMRTSINLQTQKTFYKEAVATADGTIQYNLKQMLVDESLSCDVSSVAHVEIKDAASTFLLTGGNLPEEGVMLEVGTNYGGIQINEYMSGFTIDTAAIVASRSLQPGSYVLFFYLATDQTQYDRIAFTVPEFPLPDIAFADSLGNVIDPDTVQLGTFAFVLNPVYVRITDATNCSGEDDYCKVTLRLSTSDSLYFYDENSNIIDTVETDVLGFAKFYVMSDATVEGASFKVSGIAVNNEIVWSNIKLEKPPVPNAINGFMFDRNGDGMADSLHVAFSESFAKDIPDTLDWVFGDNESHVITSEETIRGLVQNDSIIVIDNYAMAKSVFTGNRDDIYKGVFKYHYTHIDDSTGMPVPFAMTSIIQDKIGPIIEKAVVIPQSDAYSILTITFSEGVEYSEQAIISMLQFKRGLEEYSDVTVSKVNAKKKTKAQIDIYFFAAEDGTIPTVGDSIRLTPGILPDLNGNLPHEKNPWVRMTGESRMDVKSPGFVHITNTENQWNSKQGVRVVSVPTDQSHVEDVVEERGLPGQLLLYDIGEMATSLVLAAPSGANIDSLLSTIRMDWEVDYFTNLGQYISGGHGKVLCTDSTVFNANSGRAKNCYENPGYAFFEWNARSDAGRLVGTGAYIVKINVKIRAGGDVVGKKEETFTMGIKRKK